jgi:hypothetical protein
MITKQSTNNDPMLQRYFEPVHVHHGSRAGFETVEEFLARGGVIERLEQWETSETINGKTRHERQKQWASGTILNPISRPTDY